MTARRRPVARRVTPRTVDVKLNHGYTGWEATVRADFPAGLLADLASGDVVKILGVLDRIVVDHNFPAVETGELATSLTQVELAALESLANAIGEALTSLPPR